MYLIALFSCNQTISGPQGRTLIHSALLPDGKEMCLTVSNAIKLTNKFQKKEKSLDKGKKMCGKALKTRLIFRGRAHEIHS